MGSQDPHRPWSGFLGGLKIPLGHGGGSWGLKIPLGHGGGS